MRAAGSSFLKSFIDLAALFRTDTKIDGKSVTIDQNALVAEVLRCLKNDFGTNTKLYIPGMFPPRDENASSTIAIVGELFRFKKEVDRLIKIKGLAKTALQKAIEDPLALKAKYEGELEQVKTLSEKLDNLNALL